VDSKVGRVYVEISSRDKRLRAGLARAQARLRAFGAIGRQVSARVAGAMTAVSNSVASVASRAKAAGGALLKIAGIAGAGLGLAAKRFASFDDAMRAVLAITSANEKEFAALEQQARQLGATTSYTAKEAAEGMVELGRAGFKAREIMASIPGVLDLARATGVEISEAATIAGNTLRAFDLDASKMTEVVDILTATANNSAQGLGDLGESLKYVAPIAKATGEDLRSTAAALGVLANQGIKGSAAGTALARAYKNLAKQDVADKLKVKLGIEVADTEGNLRPVADIIAEIGRKTKDLGSQKRIAIFDEIFGRGAVASIVLANAKAVDSMSQKLENVQGTARKTAKIMDSGLGGSFRILFSAIDDVIISVGKALEPVLTEWANAVKNAGNQLSSFIQKNPELVQSIGNLVPIVAGIGVGFVALGTALGPVSVAFGIVASAVSVVSGVIGIATIAVSGLLTGIGLLLTPIGLLTAGFGVLATTVAVSASDTSESIFDLSGDFSGLADVAKSAFYGIADALKSGDIETAAKIMFAGLKVAWKYGVAALREIWSRFLNAIEQTGATIKSTIETAAYDAAVTVDNIISAVTPDSLYEPNVLAKMRSKALLRIVEENKPTTKIDLGGYEEAKKAKQELQKLLSEQELKRKRAEQEALRKAAEKTGGKLAGKRGEKKDELVNRQKQLEKKLADQELNRKRVDIAAIGKVVSNAGKQAIDSVKGMVDSGKISDLQKKLSGAAESALSRPIFGGFETFSLAGFQAASGTGQERKLGEILTENKTQTRYLKTISEDSGETFS